MLVMLLWTAVAWSQPRVEFVLPAPADVAERLVLTGSVTTPMEAGLSPQIEGLVTSVAVDAGDRISVGQPLLRLDAALAELALRKATAATREARARLGEARRLRDEAAPLAEQGSLPQSEFASRRAAFEQAAASLTRLEAAQAEQAERLARHTLSAPFAGVIRRRHVAPGEWVVPGAAVLELVATDNLRVDVQVPQQRFAELAATQQASVSIDALPGREFTGRVVARVPALDAHSRSFLVRVELEAGDAPVVPGMSARVDFRLPGTRQAVAVPRDALLRFADGSSIVWVIDDDDTVRRQPVTLGSVRGQHVVVTEGLGPNDRVVVRGNETLRPGQAVAPSRHRSS